MWLEKQIRQYFLGSSHESMAGDWLEGAHDIRRSHASWIAALWLLWQLALALPVLIYNQISWSIHMWRKQLTLWRRHQKRQPVFAGLTLLSLMLGFWAALLISLFILDERSYDSHHEKGHRIHRITMSIDLSDVYRPHWARTAYEPAAMLPDELPEIEAMVRFSQLRSGILANDRRVYCEKMFFVDENCFQVFSYEFLYGSPDEALAKPQSMVLTENEAIRLFGRRDVIGQVVERVSSAGAPKTSYMITGVLAQPPEQSHLQFQALIPRPHEYAAGAWAYTYVLLKEGASAEQVAEKLPEFVERHSPESRINLHMQPMMDIHLHSRLDRELEVNGSARQLSLFALIGVIVLMLSAMNFVNLTTAGARNRTREVGISKALGAHVSQIVRQGLAEALFHSLTALMLAWGLAALTLPWINLLSAKHMVMGQLFQPVLMVGGFGMALFVGLLAGLYPSWHLGRIKTVTALEGRGLGSNAGLRKVLVILQFAAAMTLIIVSGVIRAQSYYLMSRRLDAGQGSIAVPHLPLPLREKYDDMRARLLDNPAIEDVTATMAVPGDETLDGGSVQTQGVEQDDENPALIYGMPVDHRFYEFFDLKLAAGRFSDAEDAHRNQTAFVLNERAVEVIGWDSPEDAVGRPFRWREDGSVPDGVVVGVVKDFHLSTLQKKIKPITFFYKNIWLNCLIVKARPGMDRAAVEAVENVWQDYVPDHAFEWQYVKDYYTQLYRPEKRFRQLIDTFGSLAVLIGLLGLVGMALFTASQRMRELAIRKVLGAGQKRLARLMVSETVLSVVVATALSWPLSWWLARQWLDHYAYRTAIPIWSFPVIALLLMGLALAAVLPSLLRAVRQPPARVLRSE